TSGNAFGLCALTATAIQFQPVNPLNARAAASAVMTGALCVIGASVPITGQQAFHWPDGKRAAVSLSFDDGRVSQIDAGLALMKKLGLKVTFFVTPASVERQLAGWKQAVADGHEIANHSLTHPCTGNYAISVNNALETYDLAMMAQQLDEANIRIEQL